MKMVTKELEGERNSKIKKETEDEIISSRVTSLIKKDALNPSNDATNASKSSETSDTTQVTTSTLVLKRIKESGNMDGLARRMFPWRKGSWIMFGS